MFEDRDQLRRSSYWVFNPQTKMVEPEGYGPDADPENPDEDEMEEPIL